MGPRRWLDCYRKLCKQKRLPLASESELGDMLAGLVHLGPGKPRQAVALERATHFGFFSCQVPPLEDHP